MSDTSRAQVDCLIIGFNEGRFEDYTELVRAAGEESGSFRDLRLAFVTYRGRPHRALDLLNALREEHRPGLPATLTNVDFLAPAVLILGSRLHADGFTFDYVNLFQRGRQQLMTKLRGGRCRAVAITTTFYIHADPVREIVSAVREGSPDTVIIIGGPYIQNQFQQSGEDRPDDLFDYLGGDIYVITREGEATLSEVMRSLKNQSGLSQVPNLAIRAADGTFHYTEQVPESNSLVTGKPDYTLFPASEYGRFLATRTAKSCPFHCAFCGFPARAGKYTYLPIEEIGTELDHIAEIGTIDTLTFIDDTFNVPKRRFESILGLMIERKYPFKWNCFYRSDYGNESIIARMREAGCEGVFLGVESGSDSILESMQKTARRHDYMRAMGDFRKYGISTYASLIVGFPGETADTVMETLSLLDEGRPEYYRAQLWYCDPATPIWQQRDRYSIEGQAFNWRHSTMDSDTAADFVEHFFWNVKESTWLPQWGFEQWSIFYLQRQGMSYEGVKRYVTLFNALVREQLIDPGADAVSSPLIGELRALSSFASKNRSEEA
ncbi:MAG: PhpK family radical SAM P-methyltransferase [Streptosporangiaceae bacterium]|nr:PhpK family radical SAM P-methyltransferase [Streptosporangiaceae bacterium]